MTDRATNSDEILPLGTAMLGTMTFGDQVDERAAAEMVDVARAAGIRTFDTANGYTGGRSEEILGRVVKSFRDEVLISTKVGSPLGLADPDTIGLTAKAIRLGFDASLRRLGTDYVDLYYLHRPDWQTPIEESLAAIAELVTAGKVRSVAQSNYAAWQVTEMHYLAEDRGWPKVRTAQTMYNLLARRVETEYAACSKHLGLFNVIYNPLAGGFLTGKHTRSRAWADGTRFSKETYRDRYWNDAQFAAVEELTAVADRAGLTLLELAFRWLRDRPLTDSILLGASSVEQLRGNLDALTGPALDAETVEACDEITAGLAGIAPHYNR